MLTTEQLNTYIDHYNVFNELPKEVMEKLFAAGFAVAVLAAESSADEAAKVEAALTKPRKAKAA